MSSGRAAAAAAAAAASAATASASTASAGSSSSSAHQLLSPHAPPPPPAGDVKAAKQVHKLWAKALRARAAAEVAEAAAHVVTDKVGENV